ncbi:hypothetical protein SOASR031_27950 [Leminorella grimontii]|nr:hypothetical protein SOASR031_27950 [Leminorella grimontii]
MKEPDEKERIGRYGIRREVILSMVQSCTESWKRARIISINEGNGYAVAAARLIIERRFYKEGDIGKYEVDGRLD